MTEVQDGGVISKTNENDMESRIKAAMTARVSHFKEQAESVTFEGVRRLMEKDLGLETYALDVHKNFIKQCLLECMDGDDGDDDASKNSGETVEQNVNSKGVAKSPEGHESTKDVKKPCSEGHESTKDVKKPCSEDDEKMEDSPVMGLLTGHKTTKSESEPTQEDENKERPSESTIKKAVRKRTSYIKANSEKITMAGLRRLLEEDLELDKYTLDPYKKLISGELDEVLKSIEVLESSTVDKKKNLKKNSQSKASKKVSGEGNSDSSDGEANEEEDEVKPRKKIASKGKMQNSEGLKKRKRPEKETQVSSKKKIKGEKTVSEGNSDAEDRGNVSEDGHSQSSTEKPVKRKEVPTPAYGKRVEHLRTVIKSCGMSVPPSIYKKVKQVSEDKREAQLIKELEDILKREGLSSNPSEKEIKDVKKRKETAKELEGIDMSNIVSNSRRRSTSRFVPPPPPPKPKVPDEIVKSDAEGSDKDDDEKDSDDDEDNDDDDDDDGSNDESQSEEFNEEDDEDSD